MTFEVIRSGKYKLKVKVGALEAKVRNSDFENEKFTK